MHLEEEREVTVEGREGLTEICFPWIVAIVKGRPNPIRMSESVYTVECVMGDSLNRGPPMEAAIAIRG